MKDRRKKEDRRYGHQVKLPEDERDRDRRKGERRTKERIPVKMWVRKKEGSGDYFHPTANLSTNGMYILTPVPQEKGTLIRLEFQLPGTESTVECEAEVVNSRSEKNDMFGISVQFVGIAPEDHRKVVEAVDNLICENWYEGRD
ncbi:MAG: PilZ domain-containing protein [bacterium]